MTRKGVITLIESLPDDVTPNDILGGLYFRYSIKAGLADLRAGRTVSNEEVLEEIQRWLLELSKGHAADA